MNIQKIENAVKDILEAIGEDPNRDGLIKTPNRVARMYQEIFACIDKDPAEELNTIFTEEEHNEMVIVKDIPFHSMCEHHLVPFIGTAHICYIPRDGKLTGLSKIARVVDSASKRPQLQERLTTQIADAMNDVLSPEGVLVIVEAEHLCMTMRGIKKPGSRTLTTAYRGKFSTDFNARTEAISLIKN